MTGVQTCALPILEILRYCRDARDVLLCFKRDIDILFPNIKVVVLLNHENPVCVCVYLGPFPFMFRTLLAYI